ncbi:MULTISPECIES: hypothetical protein [Bradyrhizobium]|uniref:Uncharacterized protein n=1 Tax=Bradyrhizobium elkanii TaxID=29448 RepID=A0A8I1YBM8_BRAEL|nr:MULTISPECIES: hypothetical protein [Bradyrhizobium]MBP1296995.1 hypothetical protein [Bradyrhizobium elkanii]QOZ17984.1 hypothetical protein XI02_25325 [Bradyrhizobium sp. CCBAU 21365]
MANLMNKLSNLIRGIGKGEKPQAVDWFGSYLDEDGIVADVIQRIRKDEVALRRWLDPWSWKFPFTLSPVLYRPPPPDHAGCLVFAHRGIRNFYGLWHADNPHTEAQDVVVEDGIITDPRHPDNFSGRVVERVKTELAKLYPQVVAA